MRLANLTILPKGSMTSHLWAYQGMLFDFEEIVEPYSFNFKHFCFFQDVTATAWIVDVCPESQEFWESIPQGCSLTSFRNNHLKDCEAFKLFGDLINSRWMARKSILLCIRSSRKIAEELSKRGYDFDSMVEFVKSTLESLNKDLTQVYVSVIGEGSSVFHILRSFGESVTDIFLSNNLRAAGFEN